MPVYCYATRSAKRRIGAVENFESALVNPRNALHVSAAKVYGRIGERQCALFRLGAHALKEFLIFRLVAQRGESRDNLAANFAAVADRFKCVEMIRNAFGMQEVFSAGKP